MNSEWDGKSKGSVIGYKLFVFFIKYLGLDFAYFILVFVVLYYLFFSYKTTKAIYYYFRRRHKYSIIRSILSIYRNYYLLGQTIIDKIAISSGLSDNFMYDFKGEKEMIKEFEKGKGGVFLSSHIGNFGIAHKILKIKNSSLKINIVTLDNEDIFLKEYLNSIKKTVKINFIKISNDLSHIFKINNALSNNEWICITGDRFTNQGGFMESKLLDEYAKFPSGIFELASRLKVPVIFVNILKESRKKYTAYAKIAKFENRKSKYLLDLYTTNIEFILKKYPLQWFNYFDFWGEINKNEKI